MLCPHIVVLSVSLCFCACLFACLLVVHFPFEPKIDTHPHTHTHTLSLSLCFSFSTVSKQQQTTRHGVLSCKLLLEKSLSCVSLSCCFSAIANSSPCFVLVLHLVQQQTDAPVHAQGQDELPNPGMLLPPRRWGKLAEKHCEEDTEAVARGCGGVWKPCLNTQLTIGVLPCSNLD